MTCIRCEIAKAKLKAMLYENMRWSVEDLIKSLNEKYQGFYYQKRHSGGVTVYRRTLFPSAGTEVKIWTFGEAEPPINEQAIKS